MHTPLLRSLILLSMLVAAACGRPDPARSTTPPTTSSSAAPISVALVYNGWELWIGNDDLVAADDPTHTPGVLKALQAGLDKADLEHTAPPGSQGAIVSYADKALVRVPLGPIAQLKGASLGTQKDYFGTMGSELVRGVTLGVAELEKAPAGPKLLVVVSDGNDTNNEAAKGQLAALKQRAAGLGITVKSVIYKVALSGEASVVSDLAGSTTASTTAALETELAQALGTKP